MPLVILESLAYNKLVIASQTGGTPELIEDNKTGFLFPAGNVETLANTIKRLDSISAEERDVISKHIKDKIIPLSLKEHLIKLKEIYKHLNR